MAKLTIWPQMRDLVNEETPVAVVEASELRGGDKWPQINFRDPHYPDQEYGHIALSWNELDDLIQQLMLIKAEQKPAGKINVLLDVLETTENRMKHLPLSSDPLLGKPGPDRDERERLNEERLNLLSEIVKRLVRQRDFDNVLG